MPDFIHACGTTHRDVVDLAGIWIIQFFACQHSTGHNKFKLFKRKSSLKLHVCNTFLNTAGTLSELTVEIWLA